jgi:hypothetical protein
MNMLDNPISELHYALAHAEYQGFSDIEYHRRDINAIKSAKTAEERSHALETYTVEMRRPTSRDFAVYAMFPQTWGSTALGHGGIGGSAITEAYTIVLEGFNREYLVYMGGQLCYKLIDPADEFFADIRDRNLSDRRSHTKYVRK